jgi:hypothetical protein
MASHDYYNSHNYDYDNHHDTSYHGNSNQRLEAPLPSLPGESNQHPSAYGSHASPFNTPFDDSYTSYNPSRQSLDQYPQQTRSHDPFTDNNAIPLQSQPYSNNKSDKPESPMVAEDQRFPPFDQQPPPMQDGGKGWRRRKVPWAVYTLSLIQIIVFIVEIAKNGKEQSPQPD